jgi:hypothetical protein
MSALTIFKIELNQLLVEVAVSEFSGVSARSIYSRVDAPFMANRLKIAFLLSWVRERAPLTFDDFEDMVRNWWRIEDLGRAIRPANL